MFLVPETMAKGSKLMFQTRIGQDQIEIPGIWPSKLEESWTIILADKSFGEDYDYEKGRSEMHGSHALSNSARLTAMEWQWSYPPAANR